MALRTPEENRGNIFGVLRHKLEEKRYAPFANPSTKNLLKIFDILREKHTYLISDDEEGNIIEISPRTFTHFFSEGPRWTTKGVGITVRQRLPEEVVEGEKYLSIIMSRDEKKEISISTCVVESTKTQEEKDLYGEFKRIGDLRTDSIHPDGKYEERSVDGNDDDFGMPKGEWYIKGESFDNAITRAYLLLTNQLFNVGEVPPLRSRQRTLGFLENKG